MLYRNVFLIFLSILHIISGLQPLDRSFIYIPVLIILFFTINQKEIIHIFEIIENIYLKNTRNFVEKMNNYAFRILLAENKFEVILIKLSMILFYLTHFYIQLYIIQSLLVISLATYDLLFFLITRIFIIIIHGP